jgi:hypothetical protein
MKKLLTMLNNGNNLKRNIMGTKEQLKEEREKIVKGLEESYRRLVDYKKQKKSPMIVMRNGKIEAVDPNENTTHYIV